MFLAQLHASYTDYKINFLLLFSIYCYTIIRGQTISAVQIYSL